MCSAKNKNLQELIILKSVLKTAREKKGLTAEELADIFCLKEWHITEIEEADTFFTFYSMAIKVKATKRIGAYLGLKESEYLSLET
jgi:ribosome-binding protein aMBF1 (putative translation factor)